MIPLNDFTVKCALLGKITDPIIFMKNFNVF